MSRLLPFLRLLVLILAIPGLLLPGAAEEPETSQKTENKPFIPLEKEDAYEGLIKQALELFEQKDYEGSLRILEQAREMYPQDAFTWNLTGAAHTKLKNFPEANLAFDKALELDPGFFPARFNRGEILFLEGKTDEALRYFQILSDNYRRNELLEFKLVLLYSASGRQEDAQRTLGRMQFPGDSPAWYYANAAFAVAQDDRSGAKKFIRAAKELFPEDKIALYEESLQEAKLTP